MTPPPSTQRCVAGRAGSGMTEPPALGMYQRTRRATLMGQPLTQRTGTMDLRGLGITAGLAVALGGIVGGAVAVSAYEPQPQEPVRLIAPMAGEVTTTDTPTTTTATEVPTVTATPTSEPVTTTAAPVESTTSAPAPAPSPKEPVVSESPAVKIKAPAMSGQPRPGCSQSIE